MLIEIAAGLFIAIVGFNVLALAMNGIANKAENAKPENVLMYAVFIILVSAALIVRLSVGGY